ncbi:MAG: twin-arginine translocase TatA/TatE family subunit [Chitinivibrionales bacterium]|nr:twin-arginine translocase TatA/TatE family subunit [Chitinivibrionales bacterium]MBD3356910.1 twin-arginine translocase TatA/TatE family subunit [Chitinivibrionales bacterium]
MIPGGWEAILILGVVVLLFGAKKIPELAKGMGTGLKEFKKATREEVDNESKEPKKVENGTSDQDS